MAGHKERIIVPSRAVNGGFDFKFETDPYDVKLHGIMTATQYTDTMQQFNDQLKPSRSKKLDSALLATGVLMVPLAVWGVRHGYLTKKRKRLMKAHIENFNARNPALYMRWNRRPHSFLSIERRREDLQLAPPEAVQGVAIPVNSQMIEYQPPVQTNEHTPLVFAQVPPGQQEAEYPLV